MEFLKRVLKKTSLFSILESLIVALLGTILVCHPEGTIAIITYILGILFNIVGIYKIINYFATKGQNDFYNHDLIYGFTAIIIGIIAMVYINIISSVFRIIIGGWIIYTSLLRISSAIQIKKVGSENWFWGCVLAVIMLICGLYIMMNSGAIIFTIGIIMIIYSIIDIIENIIFIKNINEI